MSASVHYKHMALIGLDGADWRLLSPLIETGTMPVLAGLVKQGASGNLESTMRPESSVAWSSFLTGVNPGKHGIYGFMQQHVGEPGRYEIANGSHIRAPRFWDRLAEHGITTGLIHVPFTYPPTPIDGYCISGMMTPSTEAAFAYPDSLKPYLLKRFPHLSFDTVEGGHDRSKLIEEGIAFTRFQGDLSLHLIEKRPVNLFSVVLTAIDRVQHFAWPNIPSGDPSSAEIVGAMPADLITFYQTVDEVIGQIIDRLPTESLVMLLSDHGFNGVGRKFYVNKWLEQEGYLALKGAQASGRRQIVKLMQWLKENRLARQLKRQFLPDEWGPAAFQATASAWAVDLAHTKAYFSPDGGIRFNQDLTIAERNRLKAELSERLLAIRDPENGIGPIAAVFDGASLYSGPQAGHAPDLMIEPQRESRNAQENYILVRGNEPDDPLFSPSAPYNGNHAQQGMIVLSGHGIRSANNLSAHMLDVVPTVFAALGVPLPTYLDGQPLLDLFDETQRPIPQVDRRDLSDFDHDLSPMPDPDEDQQAVEERLRNLGYID